MSDTGGFALILDPESPRPLAEIGKILIRQLELHPADAMARARYAGGILLTEVSNEAAGLLVDRLAEVGVSARCIDSALLKDLPRGFRARSLEVLPDAICAGIPGGQEIVILRESYRGVHLYALPSTVSLEYSTGECPPEMGQESSLSPRAQKLREALLASGDPPPKLVLTLHCETSIGPVRLYREDLDYSSLGERKLPHSLDNFLLLLEDLHSFSPDAWMAERVRSFLERLDPAEILYFKPEEGQNLDRWMQVWIRIEEEEA